MIALTKPDGQATALSAVLIERVEATPETVVTTAAGTQYTVVESVQDVLDELERYHVSVLVAATRRLDNAQPGRPMLRLVRQEKGQ